MTLLDRARERQSNLKLREAGENLIGFPFLAIGWVAGQVWLILRVAVALVVIGFEKGAKQNEPHN